MKICILIFLNDINVNQHTFDTSQSKYFSLFIQFYTHNNKQLKTDLFFVFSRDTKSWTSLEKAI